MPKIHAADEGQYFGRSSVGNDEGVIADVFPSDVLQRGIRIVGKAFGKFRIDGEPDNPSSGFRIVLAELRHQAFCRVYRIRKNAVRFLSVRETEGFRGYRFPFGFAHDS